jgi:hypothetical protein
MDMGAWVSLGVAAIGAATGLYAALTKASSGRVDSLCQIIDTLTEELDRLRVRIVELERENLAFRRVIIRLGLDPDEELEREQKPAEAKA